MSGKRQHFIPKFLQAGFKSHEQNGEDYVWVYRKESEPFNTNLINVGIQKHFYTQQEYSEVDDQITEAENSFCNLTKNLRECPFGKIETSIIPQFIAHLEIRTRHIRQNFSNTGELFYKALFSFFNSEAFLNYAKKEFKNKKSYLNKIATIEYLKKGYTKSYAKKTIRQNSDNLVNDLKPFLFLMAEQALNNFNKEELENTIKSNHIKILNKTIAPEIRVSLYNKLDYSLVEIEDRNLILGDSAILFKTSESHKTLVDKTDVLDCVFLPIAPNRLLLGKTDEFNLEPTQLSATIAKNSLEYFIASEENSKFKKLKELISEDALILTKIEIEESVSKMFSI